THRRDLGRRLDRGHAPGRRPHRPSPAKARRHRRARSLHPHRPRCRLPNRGWTMSERTSFGTRLLAALALVTVGFAISAWVVGALLAPGIFHDHLEMAGLSQDSSEAAHMEEAFRSSMALSWAVALAVSLILSLLVSGYMTRRLLRSISPVTHSVREVAAGQYGTRVNKPGIGREFDELVGSFNELARRLDATETTRRRMLSDLAHEMRTPLATIES